MQYQNFNTRIYVASNNINVVIWLYPIIRNKKSVKNNPNAFYLFGI